MGLIAEINKKYRSHPMHGVQFSIDETAYDCTENVYFGEPEQWSECGTLVNAQDILLKGKEIGWLKERQNGRMFDPIVVSFFLPLENPTEEQKSNPHYYEDEFQYMRFATLQQMVDYVKTKAV